ncbi:hypothetical protein ANCDUO_03319 [Ancylostoma duodenale]|uniref:PID domain-containing protein n=1 Tax=Ancylostoma duodenale TaxID=51022 RepID=A0A0C2GXZ0_9BILA|nr:hypothetical protein ANCDUO_03319 [Ancylostoma duodenale]
MYRNQNWCDPSECDEQSYSPQERICNVCDERQAAEHDISHIQIVCQDERDLNCFTYISQDAERNLCHVFCVLTADVATEIIVTLGQAFELAYKLQNGITLEEIANV